MADLSALARDAAAHPLPPAELHGVVVGLAVCHGYEVPVHDVVELVGVDALTDETALNDFVQAAVVELRAPDMSFAPLLPEEESELAVRVEALGQWCGSYLAGLAAGLARQGIESLEDTPEEVREIVRDFAAIAQVDEEAHETDAAEADFAELEEFVKVGVLLMMTTFGHETDDPPE
ncbi:MAG: UPF0149 family protein [Pseudomonadota bacterium]